MAPTDTPPQLMTEHRSNHQRRLRSPRAVAFYRWQGWTQATHPSPEGRGIVVFLGPRHPARSLAPRPL
jgi:hypothetical protein